MLTKEGQGPIWATYAKAASSTTVNCRFTIYFMTTQGKVDGPQGFEIAGKSRHSFDLNELVMDWNVSTKVTSHGGDVICERAMYGNDDAWAHDSAAHTP